MASRQNYSPRSLMLYDSSSDSSDDNIANELNISPSNVWVFGYGSLCWNPGFEYSKCVTGYVRGYVRRFWQGNTTHRGTKDKVIQICLVFAILFFILKYVLRWVMLNGWLMTLLTFYLSNVRCSKLELSCRIFFTLTLLSSR